MVHAPAAPLDVGTLKQDFPLLQQTMHGRPLTYLDSGATSQKPAAVIAAMEAYYRDSNANVHRGVYELAERATAAYEGARERVAAFIGATPSETIFVRNATEGINLVSHTWGRENVRAGDVIVLTVLEHHSNLVPWQMLAESTGATLEFIDLNADGALQMDSLQRHLDSGRVKLVACTAISNVMGSITPVKDVVTRAHSAGAVVLIDAAQAVPHLAVDVRDLDVDFLVFTGHKMLAPMGIGVLYGRQSILESMPPFLGGGEMIRRVGLRSSTWNDLPWKFEAGTPSVGDAVGLGAAVDYLQDVGMDAVCEHDLRLGRYAAQRLAEIPGLTIYGPEERAGLVAFAVDGVHPHDMASLLDEDGIAVRAGHHCTQPLHEWLQVPATTRASFYLYNDESDVETLVHGIHRAQRVFGV